MERLIEFLRLRWGEALTDIVPAGGNEIRVTVAPDKWREVAEYVRDAPDFRMDLAADFTAWDDGVNFPVVARLWSSTHNLNLLLITTVPREPCRIASLTPVWPGMDWHEREMYDMYGVVFDGHPDLKRILLPDDWVGFPFRKDYLPAFSDDPLTGPQETN